MTRGQRAALVAAVLLAVLLRLYRLDGQSFWADEGNSVALALRPLAEMARDAAQDIHPPLYYGLLHGWVALFGTGEVAVRALSALFSVGTVVLTAQLAARLWGGWAGVAAALFLAISPLQVWYAQEARMYALAGLLAAGAGLGFAELAGLRGRAAAGRGLAVYVLCAALGLYTHYAFAFLLISLNVAFALQLVLARTLGRADSVRWALAQVAALVLYLPWLPTALARVQAWPTSADALTPAAGLTLAASWLYVGPAAAIAPPWLARLPAVAGLLVALVAWRRAPGVFAALLVWLALPVLLMLGVGALRAANLKFLLLSAPALSLLLARAAAPWPKASWRRTGLAVLIVACVAAPVAVALPAVYHDARLARDDYRDIARYIAAAAQPGDAILLNAPGQADVFGLYDVSGLPVYPLPRQRPASASGVAAQLADIANRHRNLYALFWATDESDPQRLVEAWLDAHAFKAWDTWRGNVRFVLYAFPDRAVPTQAASAPFGEPPLLALVGFGVGQEGGAAGDVLQVALRWRALATSAQPYKVSVQLLDAAGQVVAQRDAEPGGTARPMHAWQVGDETDDLHGLFIPFGTPPGSYRLLVIVYEASTGRRLAVNGGDALPIGTVALGRPPTPPPVEVLPITHRHRAALDEVVLLGYDVYRRGFAHAPDTPIRPGDLLHLVLYWQATSPPAADRRVQLELVDGRGAVVAAATVPLASDAYPATQWRAGEIVRGEHDIALPREMALGGYALRLTLTGGGQTTPTLALGRVRIGP